MQHPLLMSEILRVSSAIRKVEFCESHNVLKHPDSHDSWCGFLKSKWTLEAIAAPQQLEQQLVGRLQAHQEKERKIKESLSNFIPTIAKTVKKIEETTEIREAHLKVLCDCLKEKSKHVEEVKTAKKCRKLPCLHYITTGHQEMMKHHAHLIDIMRGVVGC